MYLTTLFALAAAAVVSGHYTFPSLLVGGKSTGDWYDVRKTVNWQDNGFVGDVQSTRIRCNEPSPGTGAPAIANVTAGSRLAFTVAPNIFHPGPLSFYLAKVPAGKTAATWDGSGAVFFKIAQDQPKFGSQLTWPSNGLTKAEVTIPSCVPNGEYLLRVEHIALHVAQSRGGAQFYISCGQISVTGGGNADPGPKVAFPGAYSAQDPGILININWPIPTSYKNPGPPVFTC